ncbi:MAG: nicotinate-nucleotide--dimethylbenzimidazole phosphoribosyltransferase, partial [Treponema sp.]|nr:nicotinate-nucleotide--dimethylbenzimidazole phosphoribosyltransferase [Treponema sp.]
VTRQMALNILAGGAGINALANGTGWEITLVDAGIMGDEFPPDRELDAVCSFVRARIGSGTRNSFEEPAMTGAETERALDQGRALAEDAAKRSFDLTAIGDLGIGNTSTAAAMLVAAGFRAEDVVDRGTGIDAAMLENKRRVVDEAAKRRSPPKDDGKAILRNLGSFDFAMMAGFILGLENKGIACVLDGFPVSAAAYMAYLINPLARNWLFAGHLSKVAGHRPLLERMGLDPIVDLDMRLGEGTGAVIGGHIVELGVKAAREMASFSSAHVSDAEKAEEKY